VTTLNKDLFDRDPTSTKIPNNGVAQVVRPETDAQWGVLDWELKSGSPGMSVGGPGC